MRGKLSSSTIAVSSELRNILNGIWSLHVKRIIQILSLRVVRINVKPRCNRTGITLFLIYGFVRINSYVIACE